jgi:hypothetical protein
MGRLNQRTAIRSLSEVSTDFSHHVNKLWIEQGDEENRATSEMIHPCSACP